MSKPRLPDLGSDEEAEEFVDKADLSQYDLSSARTHRFKFKPELYRFEIHRDANGGFRARFKRGAEIIFTTETYSSKALAEAAIETFKQNGPAASIIGENDRIVA